MIGKTALTLAAVMGVTFFLFARSPGKMENRISAAKTELGITTEQESRIKPIIEQASVRIRELQQNSSTNPEEKEARIREIVTEAHSSVRTQLTAEQQEKLDQMLEGIREKEAQRENKQ